MGKKHHINTDTSSSLNIHKLFAHWLNTKANETSPFKILPSFEHWAPPCTRCTFMTLARKSFKVFGFIWKSFNPFEVCGGGLD